MCAVLCGGSPSARPTVHSPQHLNLFNPVPALAKNTVLRTTSTTCLQLWHRNPNNTTKDPWASEQRPNGFVWAHQESQTILIWKRPIRVMESNSWPCTGLPRSHSMTLRALSKHLLGSVRLLLRPGSSFRRLRINPATTGFPQGKQNRRWTKENRA